MKDPDGCDGFNFFLCTSTFKQSSLFVSYSKIGDDLYLLEDKNGYGELFSRSINLRSIDRNYNIKSCERIVDDIYYVCRENSQFFLRLSDMKQSESFTTSKKISDDFIYHVTDEYGYYADFDVSLMELCSCL
jgi:hypothetical protein